MPHRIEEREGYYALQVSGEITAAESREHFRMVGDLLRHGPAFILLAYEKGCRFLAGPRETSQLQLSVAESIGDSEGCAIAFLCPADEIFGICRQLQFLASGSKIRLAVFRDRLQAEEWLACARQEGSSNPAWRS